VWRYSGGATDICEMVGRLQKELGKPVEESLALLPLRRRVAADLTEARSVNQSPEALLSHGGSDRGRRELALSRGGS